MPALGLGLRRRSRSDPGSSGGLALGAAAPWWRGDRARLIRWVAAVALGLAAVALVASLVSRAQTTLAGYGPRRRVPVARHDLAAGQRLSAGDIDWRDLPVAALPADVDHDSPVGQVVIDRLARGEIIGTWRLAPGGLSSLAAQVGPGRRAVAIPQRAGGLDLAVGDRVDVVSPTTAAAADSAAETGESAGTPMVARAARVLAVDSQDVVVSVRDDEAAAVADALGQGQPVLALVGAQP